MKGIILAGGSGTRLHPLTKAISKQILPVYDKPMIYYPISTLFKAGIKEILIISTPEHINFFKTLLGDGKELGVSFFYEIQPKPEGLAQAFIIGEKFIGNDSVCLILGDNIFHGDGLDSILEKAVKSVKSQKKANIFGYWVKDPNRYGVIEFDENKEVISIEEKPIKPKSNYAVVGIYFYPNNVVEIAKKIKPSSRGELEITSLNQEFLNISNLKVTLMGKSFAWFDTGTHDSLAEAGEYVRVLEKRQGLKIGCIEEVAILKNFILPIDGELLGKKLIKSQYGKYIIKRSEFLKSNLK